MSHKIILAAILLLTATQASWAQTVKIKTVGAIYPPSLSQDEKDRLLEMIDQAMNDYVDAFTLLDKNQNKVTSASINKFRALFGATAELVKDYEEYVPKELVGVEEYFNGVSNRMELEGVAVRLNDATLLEIKDDGVFWVAVVKAEKDFYNYVTANTNEVRTIGGRIMDQEIRFDIPKNDISKLKIARIARVCRPGEDCDKVVGDYSRYFGLSVGAFQPFVLGLTEGGYLASGAGAGELNMTQAIGFSGGIEFYTNRFLSREAEGKHLFFVTGLRFNYNQVKAELKGYSFEAADNATVVPFDSTATGQAYLRRGSNINATEELSIGTVEIPIGLGFRLKHKLGYEVFLQVKVLPSYSFLMGNSSLESRGDYDAAIDAADFALLEAGAANPDQFNDGEKFGPFLAGVPDISKLDIVRATPEPELKGFGLAAQLSPMMIFHLSDGNPNWSLLLGADLTYSFSSPFKYSESDEILLKYPNQPGGYTEDNVPADRVNKSIVQHYLKSMSTFNVGIRIGLLHRFTKTP